MDLLARRRRSPSAKAKSRFRVLAENSSDVISRHTPDGVFLYVSPASVAILGYQPDQLQGRRLLEFVYPEDRQVVSAAYAQQQPSSGQTGTIVFRFRKHDNQYVWLESTCRTLANAETGAVTEIHASARDISARKQMEYREQVRADVLEMIAGGRILSDILRRLIDAAERQEPEVVAAGIMISAGIVYHCEPSLPPAISSSIEKQLYHLVARFGDLAAQTNERILYCDLLADPAWAELRPALVENGLRSCWSILIRSRHWDVCGAFVLYRRDDLRCLRLGHQASEAGRGFDQRGPGTS